MEDMLCMPLGCSGRTKEEIYVRLGVFVALMSLEACDQGPI